MLELGAKRPYTARQCEAQLRYLDSRREGDTSLSRIVEARKRAPMKSPRGIARVTTT